MLDQPHRLDPESEFARPDEKEIAAAITMTTSVSGSRQIVMQTYISRDAPASAFHATLDKMAAASDRQEAKAHLVEHEANLAQEEKLLHQQTEDFQGIEARSQAAWEKVGKKGQHRLSPQEETHKAQAKVNIGRYREAIEKRKADIAKCRAIIDKVD